MGKKKRLPVPERTQEVKSMNEYADTCSTCLYCDMELLPCVQCGKTVCVECRDSEGRCGFCAAYDLPANFHVVGERDGHGVKSDWGRLAGGKKLRTIPKPHVFWYDDPSLKKVVTISVTRFQGFPHYHTTIRGDNDPVWDSRDGTWTMVSDHHEHRRPFYESRPMRRTDTVKAWGRKALLKEFGDTKVYVIFANTEPRKWFYREGD